MNNEEKSYVHVALVLDASGSMEGIRKSTVESLKNFFAGLASSEDRTILDVWQFNEEVRHIVDGADLAKGAPNTLESYETDGGTALYDAVCTGIDALGRKLAAMPEADRPDGVVFAILTDGFENSSVNFSSRDVMKRIRHQKKEYSWEFQFLAANQDAIASGGNLGISADACMSFTASNNGMAEACAEGSGFSRAFKKARVTARYRRLMKLGHTVTLPGKVKEVIV